MVLCFHDVIIPDGLVFILSLRLCLMTTLCSLPRQFEGHNSTTWKSYIWEVICLCNTASNMFFPLAKVKYLLKRCGEINQFNSSR